MFHVLAGAVIGAVVGGAASAIGSLVKGEPVSWKKVGAAAIGGAVAGSVASLTFGAGLLAGTATSQVVGMTAAGALGGASEQVSDNVFHDREWHDDVAESAAIGAAVGAAGGVLRVASKPLTSLARRGAGRLSRFGRSTSGALRSHASRATAPARRWAGRLTKPLIDEAKRQGSKLLTPLARAASQRVLDPLKRRVFAPLARYLAPVVRPFKPLFRPVGRLWNKYKRLLDTKPIRTKSATSATIAMTGDVIGQAVEGKKQWDWRRTLFRGGFAALWSGPMGHHWFGALDRMIPGNAWGAVVSKIAVDQFLWAPVSGSVFFGSYSMIYDGMTPAEAWERTKRDLPRALKAQYTVWPLFHLFNFRSVPLNMRVPASASAGLGWSVFFSTLLSEDEEPAEESRVVDGGLGADAGRVAIHHPGVVDAYPPGPDVEVYGPPPSLDRQPPGIVQGLGITEAFGRFAPELMPQR